MRELGKDIIFCQFDEPYCRWMDISNLPVSCLYNNILLSILVHFDSYVFIMFFLVIIFLTSVYFGFYIVFVLLKSNYFGFFIFKGPK